MLVGGMTFEGQPALGQPGLYLFVKASVQELRDDATERSTSAEPGVAEAEKAKPAAEPAKAAPARKTPRRK